MQQLAICEKNSVPRIAADILHQVCGTFWEHASPILLCNLIGHRLMMCSEVDSCAVGVGSGNDVLNSIEKIVEISAEILGSVHNGFDSGPLVVWDGVIVNPNQDADN